MKLPLALLMLLTLAPAGVSGQDFVDLLAWLPGHYDTYGHAGADEAQKAAYRHVRAELRILRLPPGTAGFPADTPVFYLEQALAEQLDKPYRQRILVFENDALFDYKIENPQDLAGAAIDRLKSLKASRLVREAGCEVRWTRVDRELFKGSAGPGKSCHTTLRGATHVISYSELTPKTLVSLDQGFDDSGSHKWGPPPGVIGHIFRKRTQ